MFAFAATSSTAFAQAWAPLPGHGTVGAGVQYLTAEKTFDADGRIDDIPAATQVSVPVWLHVGAHRHLSVTLSGELIRHTSLGEGPARIRTAGVGDLELGLWTPLVQQRFVASAGVIAGLPIGADHDITTDGEVPTGDGEFDVRPTIAIGGTLTPGGAAVNVYATGNVGAWLRTEGFTHALRWFGEVGFSPGRGRARDRVGVAVQMHGVTLLGDASAPTTFTGLGDGVAWTAFGLALRGSIHPDVTVEINLGGALSARNTIASAPLGMKVFWNF